MKDNYLKKLTRELTEFQIVMGIGMENTQKKLDKAFKRNIENQVSKSENITPSQEEASQEDNIPANPYLKKNASHAIAMRSVFY